ncbi:acyl-CoA synthetase FdrA [Thermovenabulum sp.]|uniref:acyl-CoA synthetase FdrA n=1 Tax=Thermovenabulum sp. TaxID=3100335 RepID=UPI003C7AE61D
MVKEIVIKKNSFFDSVMLMTISREVKNIEGIKEAVVVMATDFNKETLKNVDMINDEVLEATPNDLVIAIKAENEQSIEVAKNKVEEMLTKRTQAQGSEYNPRTLEMALQMVPDLNLALISVPGMYAAEEAKKALEAGLHVMLFSDNVSLEDEIKLKNIAREKGLLMMGPDCGTAIINGVPLAFANKVRRGKIGIVGASGTGTQEVSSIITRLGGGVSQVIGTGGRDLKAEVGGIMMTMGIEALIEDDETDCIVLISKPPAKEVMERVIEKIKNTNKKVIVHFIGADLSFAEKYGLETASTLEETAFKAYEACYGKLAKLPEEEEVRIDIEKIRKSLNVNQKYIRGLYSGGSLCDEAMVIMKKKFPRVYSNIALTEEEKLPSKDQSIQHTVIDMGDDEFTRGKPHPMIDYTQRVERILKEAESEEVAVILLDVVLGYGAHKDPSSELVPAIQKAREIALKKGNNIIFVISLCGTYEDPQDYRKQKEELERAGAIVTTTNKRAVEIAMSIVEA